MDQAKERAAAAFAEFRKKYPDVDLDAHLQKQAESIGRTAEKYPSAFDRPEGEALLAVARDRGVKTR